MTLRDVLAVASNTDPGVVRSFNEDSVATDSEIGVMVLADGMGGYKAGDVASSLATTIIMDELRQLLRKVRPGRTDSANEVAKAIREAVKHANQTIFRSAQSSPNFQGMGTTLVVLLFYDNRVLMAHIGDSRLYRLRHDRLELMTTDHSLLQEQVTLGLITSEDAKVSHNRNLVTRALGVEQHVALDLRVEQAVPGDIYVLCSDGLNDMVDESDMELVLNSLRSNLALAAKQLVMIANDNGGHDNISVILSQVLKPFPAESRWLDNMRDWLRLF